MADDLNITGEEMNLEAATTQDPNVSADLKT